VPGTTDRTTQRSYLYVPSGYVPAFLKKLKGVGKDLHVVDDNGIALGPIPAGTPVGLLSNLDLLGESTSLGDKAKHDAQVLDLLVKVLHDLKALPDNATDEQAQRVFANLKVSLLKLSKCPDFVVNRGHYFGTSFAKEEPALSDEDKRALIEFLKTM